MNYLGRILSGGKICPNRRWRKRFLLFFLLHPRRGSRLGVHATEARRAEVRAPRLLGRWGEDSALCPIETFASLVKGRGGRARAKTIFKYKKLKSFRRPLFSKYRFFARARTQGC